MNRFLLVAAIASTSLLWAAEDTPTALQERMGREQRWVESGLFLLPHRPNYFMPVSYNPNPNSAPFPEGTELKKIETKFQISAKVPVFDHLLNYEVRTYLAYTQVSYWQTYNKQKSSLFRETDYEPELFFQMNSGKSIGGWTNRFNRLGFVHQSNGQSDPMSRSWNRLYVEFFADYKKGYLSLKPWYRLTGPAERDSNPDMWKYLGYGELRGALKVGQSNELSFLFRNNLQSHDNKGAIELGWAFPLLRRLKGFIQYFNGYGETLLDYNIPTRRISAGFSITDWL